MSKYRESFDVGIELLSQSQINTGKSYRNEKNLD